MKKYIFNRILRSIISIFIITTIAYLMIFTMIPRENIFIGDATYTKLSAKPDEKVDYVNGIYDDMGYLEFYRTNDLCRMVAEDLGEGIKGNTYSSCIEDQTPYLETISKINNNIILQQYTVSGDYYGTREIPTFERVGNFYSNLIQIDHPWKIQDPENPDIPRYITIGNDDTAGLTLKCSGCRHKYLIYFDSSFPFIHQNIIKMNLGISYPSYAGLPVTDVIFNGQGETVSSEVVFETGVTQNTALNIHTCKYKTPSSMDTLEQTKFTDSYADCKSNYKDPSMVMISVITGLTATILVYAIAIPAGILMARLKGKVADKVGTAIITLLIALPSLAIIYFIRVFGSKLFGIPELFSIKGAGSLSSYILPVLALSIISVGGLTMWMRRYMIDQQSADYVKFAKAKGLSDKEISRRHIFRNAVIPLVQGIAASIILTITGATMTETVFGVPGTGKMVTDAIKSYNNNMVIGLLVFFSTLSIAATIIGDIALSKVDPRIKLHEERSKE